MLGEITEWILTTIRSYGVFGVFIGVLIEAIIAPIPSPIIVMTAGLVLIEPGLALSTGLWKIFWIVTIPASIGQTIGNYVVYGIAHWGGKPLIKKYKKWLGFSWRDVIKLKRKFGKNQSWSLFILRAIPVMPLSIISGCAGLIKIDWKKYGLFSFLGLIPRNFVLAFIGWRLSNVYVKIADKFDNIETLISLTLVGGFLLLILVKRFKLIDKIEKMMLR
ncbi:MAG: hypothetical protein MAG795_00318 [Candidatus Woesearchaeota archaeon]|nr:hypothetical protein [Candidatus Woesearchaeota archaeon]